MHKASVILNADYECGQGDLSDPLLCHNLASLQEGGDPQEHSDPRGKLSQAVPAMIQAPLQLPPRPTQINLNETLQSLEATTQIK